jgi:hypothetical protein
MKHGVFHRVRWTAVRLGLAGALAAGLGLFSTATPAFAATTSCTEPALTQPFLSWGDSNWYTLMSGETPDNFSGTGWTLSGGAKIVTMTLADGTTGQVLDMPYGAVATSPTICVNSSYPTARTMIRDVVGAQGVQFYVNYPSTPGWKNTGQLHGPTTWTLSGAANLQTSSLSGWQLGQFEFANVSSGTDVQLYNYYVDPYSKR